MSAIARASTYAGDAFCEDAVDLGRGVGLVHEHGLRDGELLGGLDVCVVSGVHD